MSTFSQPKLLHRLIHGMESNEYHAVAGTFSSSQFKDALEDEEIFFKKWIEKSIEKEESSAFDVGTYFHTGVLEPHKLKMDCAVYRGIRRGREWDAFKAKNKGKTIITPAQHDQANGLIKVVNESPIAMSYVKSGKPEVSVFVELAIWEGEIYAPKYNRRLTRTGWEKYDGEISKKAVRIVVKARADNLGDRHILDLKSTTGNAKSHRAMKDKVSYYRYELSAALYCDLFTLVCGRLHNLFIWTFASKDFFNCRSYRASEKNLLVGRSKYMKSILKIAEGLSSKWVFGDVLETLEPNQYELEYLAESDLDLA